MIRKAICLSVLLLAPLASYLSAGTYSGGDGSAENPYRIATPNDLNDIGNQVEDFNKCFVMVNDINMAGYTYTAAVIAPDISSSIGFQGTEFTGVFDGNEHAITNFTIDTNGVGDDYLGLFGQIDFPGRVKNLGIEDVTITGGSNSYYLGGLCGYVKNQINDEGTISNCYATGSVTGGDDSWYLGGLCGYNRRGNLKNCWVAGSVSGEYESVRLGGLCGYNYWGSISNCYSGVSVFGQIGPDWVGGLCGENRGGTIIDCYSSGDVSGVACNGIGGLCGGTFSGTINSCYATGSVICGIHSHHFGGLCGYNEDGKISDCYATGSVSGGDDTHGVGGLCGYNARYVGPGYGTISRCYATGSVTTGFPSSSVGGLCGSNYNGTITNCYFLDPSDGGGPDNGIGTPLTDTGMKEQSSFVGWDFVSENENGTDDIWRMCLDGVEYPKLSWKFMSADFLCPDGVNFIDYTFFAKRWMDTNCGYSNDCDGCDLDFSDKVDANDLNIFADHWLEGKDYD